MATKAPTYELIKDYGASENYISVNAYWIIAVVRLSSPFTFSRETLSSLTIDPFKGAGARAPVLIITDDCIGMNVSNPKESHTKTLTAQIKQSNLNYLKEILPGDWVLGWMMNDKETFNSVLKRIQNLEPCNNFSDGFKFLGRVHSIRKKLTINGEDGKKSAVYLLNSIGFQELDTQLYYDFSIAEEAVNKNILSTWLMKLGLDIQKVFQLGVQKQLLDNVELLIETLLNLIVGKGVSEDLNPTGISALRAAPQANQAHSSSITTKSQARQNELDVSPEQKDANPEEAPLAYLVPRAVSALMGINTASKRAGITSYADILKLVKGVQKYDESKNLNDDLSGFIPNKSGDLLGSFIPNMLQMCNQPVWSVLRQYLNPAINEMYTCLRINQFGDRDFRIVPTIVLRQQPFTTEAFKDANTSTANINIPNPNPLLNGVGSLGSAAGIDFGTIGSIKIDIPPLPTTKFLNVPRWVIHPTMVKEGTDIGRSDATRFNFVHVYGDASYQENNIPEAVQIANNPPIRDDVDIQRSGLRAFSTRVACGIREQIGKVPTLWMALCADKVIGSQYTLNGTIISVGIQSPICEGDNLEWDSIVYHIESVNHTGSIDPVSGRKVFTTQLAVANGLSKTGTSDINTSNSIYAGINEDDLRGHDPQITIITENPKFGNSQEEDRISEQKPVEGQNPEGVVLSTNERLT